MNWFSQEWINLADDFTYTYYAGTNRLRNTGGQDYQYDAIGNLTADPDNDVSNISWTPYGKVRMVTKTDGSTVSYKYDGSGNRIAKAVVTADSAYTLRYLRDASGNVMAIYKEADMTEQPIYGSSRLGMYKGGTLAGYRMLGNKQYELSNHLGNVLAVITDNIDLHNDSIQAKVVSVSDYYPFGLTMASRTFCSDDYRYGFNGKEKDGSFGETSYDYGFRIYNPRIGRWLSTDEIIKADLSQYQFSRNNPVNYIDPDGKDELHFIEFSDGTYATVYLPTEGSLKMYVHDYKTIHYPNIPGMTGHSRYEVFEILNTPLKYAGYAFYDLLWVYDRLNENPELVDYLMKEGRSQHTKFIAQAAAVRNIEDKIEIGIEGTVLAYYGVKTLTDPDTWKNIRKFALLKRAEASANKTDISKIVSKNLRMQKQVTEHVRGGSRLGTNSFLNSIEDSEDVLNAAHDGKARILSTTLSENRVYVEYNGVKGYYNNNGTLIETNKFLIKGKEKLATVVPIHPSTTKFK